MFSGADLRLSASIGGSSSHRQKVHLILCYAAGQLTIV
jgi:hypothetical protein